MNENPEREEGKAPGGDIVVPERQHGKVWRFLDNIISGKRLSGCFF